MRQSDVVNFGGNKHAKGRTISMVTQTVIFFPETDLFQVMSRTICDFYALVKAICLPKY